MSKDDNSMCSEKQDSFMGSNSMNEFCDQRALLFLSQAIFAYFLAVFFKL